jgi:hypothetical protein
MGLFDNSVVQDYPKPKILPNAGALGNAAGRFPHVNIAGK